MKNFHWQLLAKLDDEGILAYLSLDDKLEIMEDYMTKVHRILILKPDREVFVLDYLCVHFTTEAIDYVLRQYSSTNGSMVRASNKSPYWYKRLYAEMVARDKFILEQMQADHDES